jgi:hypothetical protein
MIHRIMYHLNQMTRAVLLAALALGILEIAACNRPEESGVKVIVGAKLIAAPGRAPIEYSVVVIDSGKFREVGPQASTPVPKGGQMIRGIEMTIEAVPGGSPIEPGQPANLVMKGSPEKGLTDRVMRNGEWVR